MENMQQMTPKESFQTPLKSTASERVHENQQANQHFKELVEKTNSFVNRSSKPPSELHSNGHIGAKTIEFLANRFNSERVRITAQKTDSKQRDPLSDSAQIYQIASDLKNKTECLLQEPRVNRGQRRKIMETLRGRDTANALMAVTEELNELKRRTTDIPKPQELQEEIKEKFSRLSKAIEEQELEKKDVLNKFRDKSVRESHRMHEMIESPPTGPSDKILEKLREELMEMQRKVAEAEMLRVHLEEEVRRKEQEQALLHQECSLVRLKLEKERREFDEQCRIELELKENARRELEEARRSRSQKKELLEQMKAALMISEQARMVTLSQLQEFRGNLTSLLQTQAFRRSRGEGGAREGQGPQGGAAVGSEQEGQADSVHLRLRVRRDSSARQRSSSRWSPSCKALWVVRVSASLLTGRPALARPTPSRGTHRTRRSWGLCPESFRGLWRSLRKRSAEETLLR
jgi:hypothetical protein